MDLSPADFPAAAGTGQLRFGSARMRLHRVRRYAQITRIVLRHGLALYLRGSRRRELGTA